MLRLRFEDYALVSLRYMIVLIFLYHGIPKAFFWTAAMDKFVEMGFPGFLGPITGFVEIITSILIVLGFYSKISNLILAFIMAGALVGVHIPASIQQGTVTAGLERDLMLIVGVLYLAAVEPGVLTLTSRASRRSLEGELLRSEK